MHVNTYECIAVDPRQIYDEGDYPWYRCETSNAW